MYHHDVFLLLALFSVVVHAEHLVLRFDLNWSTSAGAPVHKLIHVPANISVSSPLPSPVCDGPTIGCFNVKVSARSQEGTMRLPVSGGGSLHLLRIRTTEHIDKIWFTNASMQPVAVVASSVAIGPVMFDLTCDVPLANQEAGFILLVGFGPARAVNCILFGSDANGTAAIYLSAASNDIVV